MRPSASHIYASSQSCERRHTPSRLGKARVMAAVRLETCSRVDGFQVGAHGALRDAETAGDLGVSVPGGDQMQQVPVPGGELGDGVTATFGVQVGMVQVGAQQREQRAVALGEVRAGPTRRTAAWTDQAQTPGRAVRAGSSRSSLTIPARVRRSRSLAVTGAVIRSPPQPYSGRGGPGIRRTPDGRDGVGLHTLVPTKHNLSRFCSAVEG